MQLVPEPAAPPPPVVERREVESRRQRGRGGLGAVRGKRLGCGSEREQVLDARAMGLPVRDHANEPQRATVAAHVRRREGRAVHRGPDHHVEHHRSRRGVPHNPLGGQRTPRRAANLARPQRPHRVLEGERRGRPALAEASGGRRKRGRREPGDAVCEERHGEERADGVLEEVRLVPEARCRQPLGERRGPDEPVPRPQVPLIVPRDEAISQAPRSGATGPRRRAGVSSRAWP